MTFNNRATMKEKVEQLRNDQRNASTLHQFASSEAGEIGGRFAKPATVNASQQAVHYPKLPTSSPWSCDPVPPEEPLGIDVNEPVVTGEPFEVEASQQPFSWMKDRPNSLSSHRGVGVDDVVAAPASSSTGCSTSLSEPRAASVDGATISSNHGGRGSSAPSTTATIKRRLR